MTKTARRGIAATYALPLLAFTAAQDLAQVSADRSAPIGSALELSRRLQDAAFEAKPSVTSAFLLQCLRESTRGGQTASAASIRQFAGDVAERITVAVKAQPMASEYEALGSMCLRLSEASQTLAPRIGTRLPYAPVRATGPG